MLTPGERRRFDARFSKLWEIDPTSIIPQRERHQASIMDVKIGGVIRLKGAVYVVTKTATYTETNDKYTKDKEYVATELVLFSFKTGETHYLEWAVDDEVDISFVERKLTKDELNRRLRDDEGAAFDVDDDIDECAEREWGVQFNRRLYDYDDDWACRYDDSDGRSYQAYIYEFGSDVVGWLTIEAWKDGSNWEYEGYLSETIAEDDVEVVSTGSRVAKAA